MAFDGELGLDPVSAGGVLARSRWKRLKAVSGVLPHQAKAGIHKREVRSVAAKVRKIIEQRYQMLPFIEVYEIG
jgi:hypothetical protein